MLSVVAPVLAHQGGWDELLVALVPVVALAVLIGAFRSGRSRPPDRRP